MPHKITMTTRKNIFFILPSFELGLAILKWTSTSDLLHKRQQSRSGVRRIHNHPYGFQSAHDPENIRRGSGRSQQGMSSAVVRHHGDRMHPNHGQASSDIVGLALVFRPSSLTGAVKEDGAR